MRRSPVLNDEFSGFRSTPIIETTGWRLPRGTNSRARWNTPVSVASRSSPESKLGFVLHPGPVVAPDRSSFVLRASMGYALSLNDISDFNYEIPPEWTRFQGDPNVRSLDQVDVDSTLPLTERYFLGGLGTVPIAGVQITFRRPPAADPRPKLTKPLSPTGVRWGRWMLLRTPCNDIDDEEFKDFEDLDDTDVIGGNKFVTASVEYRFPISDTLGLQGILFLDTGNAFAEGESMFDIDKWRWGTGGGVQWFSPFGPLTVILGFPIDPLPNDDSPVFESRSAAVASRRLTPKGRSTMRDIPRRGIEANRNSRPSLIRSDVMTIHKALVLRALSRFWSRVRRPRTSRSRSESSTSNRPLPRPMKQGGPRELARKQREAEGKLAPLYERYKGLEDDLKAKKFVLSDEALFRNSSTWPKSGIRSRTS